MHHGAHSAPYRDIPEHGETKQTFTSFYFFYPYNARLVATKAALVHRFLTYLSRVFKSRLSIKTHYGFSG
jgi:hypothetical protein